MNPLALSISTLAVLFGVFTAPAMGQDYGAMRQACENYGFTPGTDAFAQCVQKLDAELRARQDSQGQQTCQRLAANVRQWCSNSYPNMPSTAAFNCGQAQANYRQSCR
jgi:hypothetical protein